MTYLFKELYRFSCNNKNDTTEMTSKSIFCFKKSLEVFSRYTFSVPHIPPFLLSPNPRKSICLRKVSYVVPSSVHKVQEFYLHKFWRYNRRTDKKNSETLRFGKGN